MSFFITEKETEAWLELETRPIRMPDGTARDLTDFRMLWASYDFLVKSGRYTPEELVEFALLNQGEVGGSFDDNFQSVVAYIDRRIHDMR